MGTSSPSADQRRQGQGVGRGGRGQASRGRGGGRGVLHPLPAAAQPTGRHQKQEYNPQTNTPHWRARQAHGSDFSFRAHDGFQPTDRAADQPRGDSPWNSPFLVPTGPAAGGRVHDPSVPFRARWVAHQEGKVGASASGRDMLWMAHCRMPSKGCCGQSRDGDSGPGQSLGGRPAIVTGRCPPTRSSSEEGK